MNSIELKTYFDKFGDDLSEVILSYLPIADKIRLESTSKLIQSLIFNKQTYLRINNLKDKDPFCDLNELFSRRPPNDIPYDVNCQAFESVLKKFKNLNKLCFECDIITSEMIETIAVNCGTKLKTLLTTSIVERYYQSYDISDDCLQILAQKCGSSLQSLRFDELSDNQMRQLMSSAPELRSVTVDNIASVVNEDNHKLLPKLEEIVFRSCNEKTLNQFQNQYSDNMLKISLQLDDQMDDPNAIIRSLTGFGRFRCLQSLDISIGSLVEDYEDSEQMSDDYEMKSLFAIQFRPLGEKLVHLKELSVTCHTETVFPNKNLLSLFSSFKSLSSLEIKINGYNKKENAVPYNYGSVRDLRHLTQLRHLSLNVEQLSDASIENIDRYLPQLVSISLESYTEPITDKSLIYLSQIKYLSEVSVCCAVGEEENITDSGLKQLIDNCPQLRCLTFYSYNDLDFGITDESIKAMILRSERMPKIQFNFSLYLKSDEKCSQLNAILDNLPPNLLIKINKK